MSFRLPAQIIVLELKLLAVQSFGLPILTVFFMMSSFSFRRTIASVLDRSFKAAVKADALGRHIGRTLKVNLIGLANLIRARSDLQFAE